MRAEYQAVYKDVSAGFLKCLTGASFRMTFAIQPRIDLANKSASIVFVHHGAWTEYWAFVEITGVVDGTTVRVNTNTFSALSDLGQAVERWANGSPECPETKHLTNPYPLQE